MASVIYVTRAIPTFSYYCATVARYHSADVIGGECQLRFLMVLNSARSFHEDEIHQQSISFRMYLPAVFSRVSGREPCDPRFCSPVPNFMRHLPFRFP